jgi:endonuclease YncB( thermonuclease family)
MKHRKVISFSRDYRRPKPFSMGLPRKRKGWRRKPTTPERYLKLVIVAATLLLGCLQFFPDATLIVSQRLDPNSCRIVSVTDGDTVRVWCPGKGLQKARLLGFDTPETFRPRCFEEFAKGTLATWYLRVVLLRTDELTIVRQGTDRFGRVLVKLWVDGRPLAQKMIEKGLARPYSGGQRKGWCG